MFLTPVILAVSGEVKQKNVVADGRNRRVLKDIGNLVNDRAIQAKVK